jgi:hypothetical protein
MAMTQYLYFEAAILQAAGRFEEATRAANDAILLHRDNFDAEYVRILSLYAAGESAAARRAVADLEARAAPEFEPVSGWTEPFPQAVADAIQLSSKQSLHGVTFNDGLTAVFADLGWRDTAI